MPRFAANLSMMFQELPFLDRFAAAAVTGFRAVEFLFPYEFEPAAIAQRLREWNLENALFNLPPGDFPAGERGIACLPGREPEFRETLGKALDYAGALGTRRLHVTAGIVPAGTPRGVCEATFIRNLGYAAGKAAERDITLLIEPINTRDIPGYFLNTQAQAYAIRQAVGAENLKMQMDCYHMQIAEGDLSTKFRQYLRYCGHIQIAGVPERHEPDRGEVNYNHIFALLDELGYEGWIGCEYRPAGKTVDGLGWLKPFGIAGNRVT
jgi:hydroxypyruvate isomerase